jgi:hypothetical protein
MEVVSSPLRPHGAGIMESTRTSKLRVQMTIHGVLLTQIALALCFDMSLTIFLMRLACAYTLCAVVEPGTIAERSKPRLALAVVVLFTLPTILLHLSTNHYVSTAERSALETMWDVLPWRSSGHNELLVPMDEARARLTSPTRQQADSNLAALLMSACFTTFTATADRISAIGLMAIDFTVAFSMWMLLAPEKGLFDPQVWHMVPRHRRQSTEEELRV